MNINSRENRGKLLLLLLCLSVVSFTFGADAVLADKPLVLDIDKEGRVVLEDGRQIHAYRMDKAAEEKFLKSYLEANDNKFAPWIKAIMKKYPGISVGEILGITDYTMSMFVDFNKASRNRALPIDLGFRFMLSGLNKLPNFKGTVYRADFFQEEVSKPELLRRLAQYRRLLKSGKAFVSLAALSTTLARTDTFGPDRMNMKMRLEAHNAIILEIKSLTGKRIQEFSASPEEEEVLFLPGTRFKIEKITEEEVPQSSYNPIGKSFRIFMSEMH